MPARMRIKNLYELVMDFLKKCSDDHVGAFGAMSAFFYTPFYFSIYDIPADLNQIHSFFKR